MSFKGTDHYRRKVALFEDGQEDWISRISGEWVAKYYTADIKKLCGHIDLLEEVVSAARVLILGPNGEEWSWVQKDDWRNLDATLKALQTEASKEKRR